MLYNGMIRLDTQSRVANKIVNIIRRRYGWFGIDEYITYMHGEFYYSPSHISVIKVYSKWYPGVRYELNLIYDLVCILRALEEHEDEIKFALL
jgi:hypothetical protein